MNSNHSGRMRRTPIRMRTNLFTCLVSIENVNALGYLRTSVAGVFPSARSCKSLGIFVEISSRNPQIRSALNFLTDGSSDPDPCWPLRPTVFLPTQTKAAGFS
jgi:hypothetical protein